MKWQTEVVHETQNQRQTVWSKKRVNNRKLMQSCCCFLYISLEYYSLSGEKKKKIKRSAIRQFAVQWHWKGQGIQTGSIMKFIGNISGHTRKNTWATALAAACWERILLTEQLAWKGRRRKNNFRDWKPTISLFLRINLTESHSKAAYWETPQKMK